MGNKKEMAAVILVEGGVLLPYALNFIKKIKRSPRKFMLISFNEKKIKNFRFNQSIKQFQK